MTDKLSRVLRVKSSNYLIQFVKNELTPQIRMSMVQDLSRIIFEVDRKQFPQLGTMDNDYLEYEKLVFLFEVLMPHKMLLSELHKANSRGDIINQMALTFWVPKSIVSCHLIQTLQLQLNSQKESEVTKSSHTTFSPDSVR